MNNRVFVAALVGGIAMFLIGWLVWGILLMDTLRDMNPRIEGLEKDPPNLVFIFLSNVIWMFFYAIIFSRWAGISTFRSGAIAGAWMSGLIALSLDLMFLATTNMIGYSGAVVDVVANIVVGAIGGGIIGWVLGYKQGA